MVRLSLHGLGAVYGQRRILSNVTTPAFEGGQLIAVVGPNAAGKSTLFKRIAGLIEGPGEIRLEGSAKGMAGIGYMPQDTVASARLTVYESILLACKQHQRSWAVDESEHARIDATMAALGIGTLAFRYLDELSGGQRQLVSIAQTLARDPDVMLMDEPTSALDVRRQVQVLETMRTLARQRGMIVLIALHDLNQALRFADQVLVIAGGTVRGVGPGEEIVTVAMLEDVYEIRARIERCSMGTAHVIVDGVASGKESFEVLHRANRLA